MIPENNIDFPCGWPNSFGDGGFCMYYSGDGNGRGSGRRYGDAYGDGRGNAPDRVQYKGGGFGFDLFLASGDLRNLPSAVIWSVVVKGV